MDKAYKAFFRRVKAGDKPGLTRFKGNGRYRSMAYSHLSVNLICGIGGRMARIVVPKVGAVKIRLHRPLPAGKIKTLTIQRKARAGTPTLPLKFLTFRRSKSNPLLVLTLDWNLL